MITKITKPRQTSFGSLLYYKENGETKAQEFATESEAREFQEESFAELLRREQDKLC